jgi:hypothetical protein
MSFFVWNLAASQMNFIEPWFLLPDSLFLFKLEFKIIWILLYLLKYSNLPVPFKIIVFVNL